MADLYSDGRLFHLRGNLLHCRVVAGVAIAHIVASAIVLLCCHHVSHYRLSVELLRLMVDNK